MTKVHSSDEELFQRALRLFEEGCISSGKAGELCGMERVEFLLAVSRAGVSVVDLTEEEMSEEFSQAEEH